MPKAKPVSCVRGASMGRSSIWCVTALIASALLLSAASGNTGSVVLPSVPNQQQSQTNKQVGSTPNPPPSTSTTVPATSTSTAGPKDERGTSHSAGWQAWFWPPNWSNWALVVVAIIAACIAVRTLKEIARQSRTATINTRIAARAANAAKLSADAAKQSADTSSRELVIANRAYLYLSEVTIRFYEAENVFEEDTRYKYEIVYPIFNGGQTPALYLGPFARTIVSGKPPQQTSEAALTLDRPQSAVIPPNTETPVRGIYSSFVSEEELDDLRAGKRKLFFYGGLTYLDIFGLERHTWFTLSFAGTPAEPGKSKPMAFESGKGLNGFD
ncbi:MAG TPA: hypothetical protein VEC38_12830 [Candidatus Binataceae bacterium]|nr:hypothetical protein [Candidatus Binataceae bacterium]